MRARAGASALALLVASSVATGCGGCNGGPSAERDAGAPRAPAAPGAVAPARIAFDLIAELPRCDIEHRGLLLDGGTPAILGRLGWKLAAPTGLKDVEHDGSTWAQVYDRSLSVSFTWPEAAPMFVAARAMGADARAIYITLDEQPLGTISLVRDRIRVGSTPTTTLPLDAGAHVLNLRFMGRSRDPQQPFAELDWLRIGTPDENEATYGPPTLSDVVAPTAALGGVPHHAIAMRSPAALRCGLLVPRSSRLRTAVGLEGGDEADVEIRVVRDHEPPEVLQSVHLTGGPQAAWTDLDLPLDRFASSIAALELRVMPGLHTGRVLFGDPAVVLPLPAAPTVPKARAVVLVVLDGVERQDLPPWNAAPLPTLPVLTSLAQSATVFARHRAPTTFASGAFASMLTGLSPRGHTLTDLGSRLPAAATTIATIAGDAGVHTAMFTGVPTTFRAFGFGGSWERFSEFPPQGGAAATAPLDEATAWLQEVLRDTPGARVLAVVHARGGHPPWDVTSKELAAAAPADYGGALEPRRGAQMLARARDRGVLRTLSGEDLERARALAGIGLAGQDRALGAVIEALTTAGAWDETLFMVTADVSSGPGPSTLFGDGLDPTEPILDVPLYVHFPGEAYGGARVEAPTEAYDLARTSLLGLGLALGKRTLGRDLATIASGVEDSAEAPRVATMGDRYSARWGHLVLTGRVDRAPSLCDLDLDATCAFDRRDSLPFAAQWLFRRVVAADLASAAPAGMRDGFVLDADTAAALRVWGAIE